MRRLRGSPHRGQTESGAALRDKITFTEGMVDQANFDTYEPPRISDMPVVEVHIMPSHEAPTGKRLRSLPFSFDILKGA